MLQQLQKSLDSVGSNMRVTTDSSSPDYAVVFGGYYMNYSLKNIKQQVSKLRGQVYYWSRQMPVTKGRRPKKNKSV